MEIYHGSTEAVVSPEIRKNNRTLDFGAGFYTTTSYDQAVLWVIRKVKENNLNKGFINVYEFDEKFLSDFKCLFFDYPTEEWVDFVMQNRMNNGFVHDYDIVYGPVTNDKVYASFALYEGGFLSKQMLISELKTYKLVDQYLFHTDRSLQILKYIESKEVGL